MKTSAGLLMYRRANGQIEFFLAHPGGPFYARKDVGVWTIPKGEPNPGEELVAAARREFFEETGITPPPADELIELGSIKQKGGKVVHAWAFEGEWAESDGLPSNRFDFEWPPRSGKFIQIPEVDRAGWFSPSAAKIKINPAQAELLERLLRVLDI